ncbi:DNA polymerase lambda isoform X2 [Morus notabilis]|uniref:DNA polymerase lambda isoform X2 n=1 Tax=Morus notabilis TaxID=981085 RepID=UPI000CED6494|nr:DNA polymerase lambda isoform X2 [Morus notabilis]
MRFSLLTKRELFQLSVLKMAPKKKKSKNSEGSPSLERPSAPTGMFSGMVVFLVPIGVPIRRLQIWKQKLQQMGATIEDRLTKIVTHVFAINSDSLLQQIDADRLSRFQGRVLVYRWLEDSLTSGEKVSEDMYDIKMESESEAEESAKRKASDQKEEHKDQEEDRGSDSKKIKSYDTNVDSETKATSETGLSNYNPPDLNKNITQIFGRLIDIYRALGDDRRSFSYYKAIPVIEKFPFNIESAEQVKHLPSIGKSMQDHVRTISLFGEVWGIGPATALKLYEKGHRTLDDLKNESSLTNAQKLGLKYFHDIKQRIPRHEVQEMESLLKKAVEDILPGVVVICGGSFRRGKASCGDMDIVITHPDGKSHKGFLPKYVKHLKDMNFLREDLVFSTHSEEGTDSGVDTYFGLCTYPGRELRHRIDFKVYPRDIFAFGLIAWTGNDVLNRRLRLLAESKGFRLDDTGLYPATHGSPGKRGTKATASLKFNEEKEVFDFLGFPWLEPHERNL